MKAVIKLDIPDYQIGQEVLVYFKDTMCIKSICQEDSTIAELEKIKAEMIKNFWNGDLDETQEAFNQGVSKSILILDTEISELKGENNETDN